MMNVLDAAENAPKMSEANRREHSSEARSEKGEPGVCERPRQNTGRSADARGTRLTAAVLPWYLIFDN